MKNIGKRIYYKKKIVDSNSIQYEGSVYYQGVLYYFIMTKYSNGLPLFKPIELPQKIKRFIKWSIKMKEQQEFKNRKENE